MFDFINVMDPNKELENVFGDLYPERFTGVCPYGFRSHRQHLASGKETNRLGVSEVVSDKDKFQVSFSFVTLEVPMNFFI